MATRPKKSVIPKFAGAATAAKIAKYADKAVREFAVDEATRFRNEIRRQQFPAFHAFPLAPRTVLYKELNALDHRVMIATKNYVDSIRVHKETDAQGRVLYRVGFAPTDLAVDADGKPTGITLNEVAYIQEHGSRAAHIPARPHWRVHLRALRARATVLRATLAAELRDLAKGKA